MSVASMTQKKFSRGIACLKDFSNDSGVHRKDVTPIWG
jgi:hypothetical protein